MEPLDNTPRRGNESIFFFLGNLPRVTLLVAFSGDLLGEIWDGHCALEPLHFRSYEQQHSVVHLTAAKLGIMSD